MSDRPFDPYDYPEPAPALVERIRGLTVGQRVNLVDGTAVKSVAMRHGATHVRRFAVSRQGQPRLGNTYPTAEKAAEAALGKRRTNG